MDHHHVSRGSARPSADGLYHQMMAVGQTAAGFLFLPLQEIDQTAGCGFVHSAFLLQGCLENRIIQPTIGFLQESSDPFRKMEVPATSLTLPERS
jgi:hypothetical protein